MRKILVTLFFAAIVHVGGYTQTVIYLAPDGSDTAPGTQNAPMQSLQAAITKIGQTGGTDTAYVNMAAGMYMMTEPLVLTPENRTPIIFRGAGMEKTIFNGGVKITGWKKINDKLWRAIVPATRQYGYYFEQLWINGKRATRARTPNKDWFWVKSSSESINYKGGGRSPEYATQCVRLAAEDIASLKGLNADEIQDVSVMFYHKWDVTRKNIEHLPADSSIFYLHGEGMKSWNPIGAGSRYVMENYRTALDAEGEWFLDRNGELLYIPREGEEIEQMDCWAPALKQFIVIRGSEGKLVENKIFRDLSFRMAGYTMPRHGNEAMQAAAGIDAAVMVDFAKGIVFTNCEVGQTGGYGLWFRRHCYDCRVESSHIYDLGAGGIKIGETLIRQEPIESVTNNIVINNNIIQHAGYVFPCGVGVAIFNSHHNRVTHNEISDLRYTGVSVGWKWGYNDQAAWTTVINERNQLDYVKLVTPSPSTDNLIAYNNIHHIGWCELSDMGAVYTLGESKGTRIANNIISNIYSYDYGGWGLYTDEGSSDIIIENNLTMGCKSGGFHQHYGRENIIRNNIFAFGHFFQMQYTRPEAHQSFAFHNNIVLFDGNSPVAQGAWKKGKIDMHDNCYWNMSSGPYKFVDMDMKQWQSLHDQGSIIANPMFIDPMKMDFRFRNLKTARRIGFKPFNYQEAGVYGSEEWKAKTQIDASVLEEFEARKAVNLKRGSKRQEN